MGKMIEDLDGQLMPIRQAYLNATLNEKWVIATHYIDLLNNSIPPKARVTDLPKFSLGNSLKETLHQEDNARYYCLKWMPVLEKTISIHRDTALRQMIS